MRLHIEMQTQENLDAGMNPEEARYAALRQFGWVESIKETCREQRGCVWIEGLARDLRYATRLFRKHPLSNSVIMMTIALLIGAVSVIYASLREQRARLLPFPEPERLVKLWRVGDTSIESLFPADLFQEYRSGLGSFAALGALEGRGPMTLTGEGEPVAYQATGVSASVLQLAGTPPLRGRLFDESDELPGADRVAIISEQVWRGKKPEPIDLNRVRAIIDKVGFRGFTPIEALGRGIRRRLSRSF